MKTKSPEKELRFTRARQAQVFWIAGVALLCVAAGLFILWWKRLDHPPAWWTGVLPLLLSAGSFWLAARLTRHAYLLLSPVGIEIFPFIKPAQNFQLVTWAEIAEARVDEARNLLVIRYAGMKDAGVILTLDPMTPAARDLLKRAIDGVMEKRREAEERREK